VPTAADNKSYRYKAAQMVQVEGDSDPICDSAHLCPLEREKEQKRMKELGWNYKVPDLGMDKDIVDTQKHIADQEKVHGAWNPVQDENGVWQVPKASKA